MQNETIEETTESTAAIAPISAAAGPLRVLVDWLALLTCLVLLPMLGLFASDLWQRTDFRFFPIAILAFLFFALRKFRLVPVEHRWRSYWSLGILVASSLAGLVSALAVSPWLAGLAVTGMCIGWGLARLGDSRWHEIVGWTLPLWVLLALPVSDAADVSQLLESSTASSASVVLDALSIPQLAIGNLLQLRSTSLPASLVCRGLGSIYLLLLCTTLLSMLLRRSLWIGGLTVLSLPLWAWFSAVAHLVLAAYLLESDGPNLLFGARGLAVQAGFLVVTVLLIWAFQITLKNLFAPFQAYSAGQHGLHSFYSRVVSWPTQEESERPGKGKETAPTADTISNSRDRRIELIGISTLLVLAVATGILANYEVFGRSAGKRMEPLQITTEAMQSHFSLESLPANLQGMQRLEFNNFERKSTHFSRNFGAKWIYVVDQQRAEIVVELPMRGFYPLESDSLTVVSRFAEPRQSFEATIEGFGTVLLDDVIVLDDLTGRSYVGYATLTLNEFPPFRTAVTTGSRSLQSLVDCVKLQPTIIAVRLLVEGTDRTSEEERATYRQILLEVCETLRPSLEQLNPR
ncbi:archaeosortase/exosortase family protein [Aureliella helgolandensis]|uniref:Transmembrane exosortase (Exosortase_EpsH) n=1 Tax=Aureliella helgolandensis TaxID=2527968 RepID=A0A518GC30_9BACT|nr:archaeosortase/exosortase family protein [Aureliella helgolandensis]QDV26148.1 Transmembrane exosortase (Exosortase_EpsH) [Aureliella helgolandensis]